MTECSRADKEAEVPTSKHYVDGLDDGHMDETTLETTVEPDERLIVGAISHASSDFAKTTANENSVPTAAAAAAAGHIRRRH